MDPVDFFIGIIALAFYIFIFIVAVELWRVMKRFDAWLDRQERMEWYQQMELNKENEKENG